jgi:hypothetical protein
MKEHRRADRMAAATQTNGTGLLKTGHYIRRCTIDTNEWPHPRGELQGCVVMADIKVSVTRKKRTPESDRRRGQSVMEEKHWGNRMEIVVQCKLPPLIAHRSSGHRQTRVDGNLPDNEMANGSPRRRYLLGMVAGMRGSQ